jgi:uncharacterized cupredoxin-like copper-binding protein
MPGPLRRCYAVTVPLVLALTALVAAGCGDDDTDKSSKSTDEPSKATTMSVTTTDIGKKKFKTEAPRSIEGGLVKVDFHNAGKVPHEASLVRIDGAHTVEEVLKIIATEKTVIPDWLHAEGGVSTTPPGATASATVRLSPGTYAVLDSGEGEGPPPAAFGAQATFKVAGDNGGKIKDTAAKITVKDKGDDEFEWVTSGLRAGANEVTFDNPGKEIHVAVAFPIVGKATLADVKKALAQHGKPSGPPPLDFEKGNGTNALDGKRKEVVQLKLAKGRNALVCFFTDRDGKGKPHFEEGMLKELDVQ